MHIRMRIEGFLQCSHCFTTARTHKMNSFDTDFCYLAINSAYMTAQSFDFSEFVYALLASFEANAEDGESITY